DRDAAAEHRPGGRRDRDRGQGAARSLRRDTRRAGRRGDDGARPRRPEIAAPGAMRRRAMSRVEVALGDRSYPVHIESGLIEHAGEMLAPLGGKRVVISDESVWALQGARLGLDGEPILLPPGEGSK